LVEAGTSKKIYENIFIQPARCAKCYLIKASSFSLYRKFSRYSKFFELSWYNLHVRIQ